MTEVERKAVVAVAADANQFLRNTAYGDAGGGNLRSFDEEIVRKDRSSLAATASWPKRDGRQFVAAAYRPIGTYGPAFSASWERARKISQYPSLLGAPPPAACSSLLSSDQSA
jgi:hypothetical protein